MERKFYDQEEVDQIVKLYAVYRAQMESIAKYMDKEFYQPAMKAGGIPAEFLELEQKEDQEIRVENDRLNADIAKQKEEYFSQRLKMLEDQVLTEKLKREENMIEVSSRANEFLKLNLENPESCVTPENFDQIVAKSMENPLDHEFFIDKSGRIYKDREEATSDTKQASQ